MNDGFTNMYSYDIQNANPMTNPMGDWIQCGSSANQCGTSGFCHAKYAICCPKPKLRCPQPYVPTPFDFANPFHQPTEPPILPESSRCIPVPNKSGCPTNQTCVYQYSHLTNAGTLEISGVCCPNQNKLPPNVQPIAAGQTVNGLQIGSMQNGPNRQNGSNVWQNIQGG